MWRLCKRYQRPEDLEIQKLANGDEVLYVATTTTNAVYSINLATNQIQTFVSRATIDAATGLAVGNALMGKDEVTMFEMTGVVGKHLGPA